ncbi:MAG: GTP-binding protein [Desulfobacterales bacterium]|nr:GTP-binding protein [Desulfobacterales bacterium]MDP6808697.1 GTP-binding protein [Desulfobacterales bacterium]MDP7355536.1 GTP-binding protein [Desulfobacterales bacterium]
MKLVQIAGYLGSGKTTLILALSKNLAEEGIKVAILVNDVGEVPVDGKVMEEYGLAVKDIGGGCICCQVAGNMRKTLGLLAKNYEPDVTIIEPTGVAVPSAIKEAVGLEASKTKITFGPIIVLFDTTRAEKFLNYDTLKRLVSTQLRDADIIALNKVDAASKEKIKDSKESAHLINPKAKIMELSSHTGEGLGSIVDAVRDLTVGD